MPVKYHHHEVGGPGQCEIETPVLPLLQAADAILIVKYVTRMAAHQLGLTATFMPKPLYGEAGSAGCTSTSASSRAARTSSTTATGYGCVERDWRCTTSRGLLHARRGASWRSRTRRRTPTAGSSPATRRRSARSSRSGNRSAAIRIPKYANQPDNARFEFRPPDATANPYLAMAAQLLAGIDGIRKGIDPTALGFGPVDDDIFALARPRSGRRSRRCPPRSTRRMDALEADHAFLLEGDVFNEDLLERWASKKRNEDREVRNRPHPYEIELYYDL